MENEKSTLTVLMVEPGKAPYQAAIGADLKSLQQVVGGYIESIAPYDDPVAIVCNEEGKLEQLPFNRGLRDESGNLYDYRRYIENDVYKYLYGYRKGDDGKPEIIPDQAEVVRKIYDLFLSGTPVRGIQEYLNANSVPNINGEPKWARSAIDSILTNEKYCGDVLLQKTYIDDCINKKVKKNTGQLPMYLVQNHHEGIISNSTGLSLSNKIQACAVFRKESLMPRYFMRDTPLRAMERLMMSQPGHKPRGGGMYRSQFHYTPKDVECEYCQNYVRKHPCLLCECTCLEERIEAGVLSLSEFVHDCFAPSMEPQLQIRMRQQFRERTTQFFLSDAHRRRWAHWRALCWRLSDRNKAALFLLTAYESLWRRMIWKCGNDGFDFQAVHLRGIKPELYSVYQAAKAIAVGSSNITLADLASPELVTDEAFQLIINALLMAKYGDVVLNLENGAGEI